MQGFFEKLVFQVDEEHFKDIIEKINARNTQEETNKTETIPPCTQYTPTKSDLTDSSFMNGQQSLMISFNSKYLPIICYYIYIYDQQFQSCNFRIFVQTDNKQGIMDKQPISLQPEIVQFGQDKKQLIKITNHTNELIENCFFCLFNTNKYQFSPDSFSLQPKEHKLVSVTLKLRVSDGPAKQFAYLKSKNLNKRITLMNVPVPDPMEQQKFKSPQSDREELNTLTSREYEQTQKAAYERMIAEKQAYILRLERRLQQQQSGNKNRIYQDQINQLQMKIELLMKEKEQFVIENIELQSKFTEYRILCESDTRITELNLKIADKMKEIASQAEQIKYLEHQCEECLNRIAEKETKIRENDLYYVQKIDHIIKQGQKRMQQMQSKMTEQKKQFQLTQSKLTEKYILQIKQYQKQISSLTSKLQTQQKSIIQQEQNKSRIQIENSHLIEHNQELKLKLRDQDRLLGEFKEKIVEYKSKIQNQDETSLKMSRILEMSIESCKNENELLRKNKQELEKSMVEEVKNKKIYETKVTKLEQLLNSLQKQLKQAKSEKQLLQSQKIKQAQLHHDKMMALKSENIQLLQKINIQKRKDSLKEQQLQDIRLQLRQKQIKFEQKQQKYKKLIQKYEIELKNNEQQLQKYKIKEEELKYRLKQVEQQKEKITRKIQKYKKQTKKQLNNIKDTAKDELKRIQQQKNKLQEKVQQLEISAHTEIQQHSHPDELQTRYKTKTYYEANNMQNQNKKDIMSQQGDKNKKVTGGIRNQRRQLEESQANSRTQIDMDKIFHQLGQLRQYRNYVNNSIKKLQQSHVLKDIIGGIGEENSNQNSVFTVINFFRELEHKVNRQIDDPEKLLQAEKEIQFLKGRVAELELIAKKIREKQTITQQQLSIFKIQNERNMIDHLRQQMKIQYKKMYDALKLSEQVNKTLKTKIHQEYRARIIDLIAKKDQDQYTVSKIQAALERFVDGLGNMSHKEAVLAKQVKLKQQARREASVLKNKLAYANKSLEETTKKKTTCIRDHTKLLSPEKQKQWLDSIKIEAKMLTYQAQNARLIQQKGLHQLKQTELEQQLRLCEVDLQTKQNEIEKLRRQIIIIAKQSQSTITRQEEEINQFKKKFASLQKMEKQIADLLIKDKENSHLREEIQEKRQQIKNLREREKLLEQLLDESKRNESAVRQKEKKQYLDESRMQQSLRDLKDSNRQLRSENTRLKEQIDSLIDEMNKKNATLKRLKSEGQEFRIKTVKSDQQSLQKMKLQIKELNDQIKKVKEDSDKMKRKKEKQIQQKQSELAAAKNEYTIQKSTLQSIIRSLIDTISSIYCSLDIIARKKGSIVNQPSNFDDLMKNPSEIRPTKIRQCFQDVLEAVKQ